MTAEPIQHCGNPFDEFASAYDLSFTHTQLGEWLRAIVWRRLESSLTNCQRVLDVGCGTGEDAIHLASLGHRVIATDSSAGMLEVANAKAKGAGLLSRVSFHHIPMEQLSSAFAGERFDGIYSNFGAINCAASIENTLNLLAEMMTDDARMLLVIMGRYVPWEWIWYLARGKPSKAFRRLGKNDTDWRGMKISYPSPRMLARTLPKTLSLIRYQGLGIVLPPSYASAWLETMPRLFKKFAALEAGLTGWQFLATLADHFIFEAKRMPASTHV